MTILFDRLAREAAQIPLDRRTMLLRWRQRVEVLVKDVGTLELTLIHGPQRPSMNRTR